jgi:hypothetical protein
MMGDLIWILVSAMLVSNFTLALFLGLCPFMGVSSKVGTALRMGLANIFVMTVTALSVWFLNTYVLREAPYLRIISFIVVIASLVQIVEVVVRKVSPALFRELGIFLPLITTNCAILGLAIFQTNRGYGLRRGSPSRRRGPRRHARAGADGLHPRAARGRQRPLHGPRDGAGAHRGRQPVAGLHGLRRALQLVNGRER